MKPLLIIPPAPSRWPVLAELFDHLPPQQRTNLQLRLERGVSGAEDAVAAVGGNPRFASVGCIHKRGDVGVFGSLFTHPDHRRRGLACAATEALLAWFDMTGGKRLLASASLGLTEGLFRRFGFTVLRQAGDGAEARVSLLRGEGGETVELALAADSTPEVRDVSRADWPEMVAFLQFAPGPDPRVPQSESATGAELLTLDLLDHLDRGACLLKGAYRGRRLVGLASLATGHDPPRTFAVVMPHRGAPAVLREAVIETAAQRGYTQVDFPMETLPGAVDVEHGT